VNNVKPERAAAVPSKPRDRAARSLVRWYRQEAGKCLRAAETAIDSDIQKAWIAVAGGWNSMALHAERRFTPDTISPTRPN
jgi:hypothetical protein